MEERIRKDFEKQGLMKLLGAEIVSIEKGKVVMACPYRPEVAQQNGFFHAGTISSLLDMAAGYAAYTYMEDHENVLSVEFKVNMMKPAIADKLYAVGTVLQAGRKLVVCEAIATNEAQDRIFSKMQATMFRSSQ